MSLVTDMLGAGLPAREKLLSLAGQVAGYAHAEDVVQDVWITAYEAVTERGDEWCSGFESEDNIHAWLYVLTFWKARNYRDRERTYRRKLAEYKRRQDGGGKAAYESDLDAPLLADELLSSVTPQQAAIFVGYYNDGFTGVEVAEAIRLPLNEVYLELRRAERTMQRKAETTWQQAQKT